MPFDMYTGEFSHHGDLCTFEVIADRFGLQSAAIAKVGRLVHELDMKDAKFGLPEAAAVGRMVDGLRALPADDTTLLEQGIGMFDALAHSFESDEEAVRAPRATPTAGAANAKAARGARSGTVKKKPTR